MTEHALIMCREPGRHSTLVNFWGIQRAKGHKEILPKAKQKIMEFQTSETKGTKMHKGYLASGDSIFHIWARY